MIKGHATIASMNPDCQAAEIQISIAVMNQPEAVA